MQLAGEILSYMNSTVATGGAKKLGIQFGAYATALSLFGLLGLPSTNQDFTGVIDYASSLVFELVTSADVSSGFPAEEDLSVRFLFHNGTASASSPPAAFPLFGGADTAIPYAAFADRLGRFAVRSTEQWCRKCGNTGGACAAYTSSAGGNGAGAGAAASSRDSGNGISPAIGGVIGAMVTLAVVLGSLAAFMLLGGFRLASKTQLARAPGAAAGDKGGVKA